MSETFLFSLCESFAYVLKCIPLKQKQNKTNKQKSVKLKRFHCKGSS